MHSMIYYLTLPNFFYFISFVYISFLLELFDQELNQVLFLHSNRHLIWRTSCRLICVYSKLIKSSSTTLLCWKACCEHVSSPEGDCAESRQNTVRSSALWVSISSPAPSFSSYLLMNLWITLFLINSKFLALSKMDKPKSIPKTRLFSSIHRHSFCRGICIIRSCFGGDEHYSDSIAKPVEVSCSCFSVGTLAGFPLHYTCPLLEHTTGQQLRKGENCGGCSGKCLSCFLVRCFSLLINSIALQAICLILCFPFSMSITSDHLQLYLFLEE